MPDTEISKLPLLTESQLQDLDELAIADRSAVETKKVTAVDLVVGTLQKVPDGTINPNKLNWSILDSDSISGDDLSDASIADEKLIANTLTARSIAPNAIGSSELADSSVDTAAVNNRAITGVKVAVSTLDSSHIIDKALDTNTLADGAVTYQKLTINDGEFPGAKLVSNSVTALQLATNSVGSSELADSSVDTAAIQIGAVDNGALATNSVDDRVIQDSGVSNANLSAGSVTVGKLSLNNNDLPGSVIADGTITTEELQDDLPGSIIADGTLPGAKLNEGAITESKIATDAVTTTKVRDSAITDDKIASGINGAKITNSTVGPSKFTNDTFDRGVSNNGTNVGIINSVVPATTSGISWDAQGLITGAVPLQGPDLPPATASDIGAISVPAGSGLTVSGLGAIDHLTLIAAGTRSGIEYDEHGHIRSTQALIGTDLPAATTTELGGVSVPTADDNPLRVEADGSLYHQNSNAGVGAYTKVDVDIYGHVVNGGLLEQNDIPGLDASAIISGQFGTTQIANGSLTSPKFDDYATCLMQEDFPGQGDFLGQFWYTPSTAQLRVYSRGSGPQNIWLPVGFGLLQQQNLRFAFTFDATTSTINSITQYGAPLGLAVGDPIPTANDINAGAYGVCVVAGTGVSLLDVTGANFTIGDWILSAGEVAGWQHINTVDGGGGGGGALFLNDLLDVTVPTPSTPLADGQILRYDGDVGQWVNTPNAAVVAIGETPPSLANSGALWWDTNSGRLFIWYEEPAGSDQTSQWVPATPESGLTGGNDPIVPTLKVLNDLENVNAGNFAGALLRYNSSNLQWESTTLLDPGTFVGVTALTVEEGVSLMTTQPTVLNDLTDVNAALTDRAFLQFNAGNGVWESQLNFDGGNFPVVRSVEDIDQVSVIGTTSTVQALNDFLDVEVQEVDEAYFIYNGNLNRWEDTTTINGGDF